MDEPSTADPAQGDAWGTHPSRPTQRDTRTKILDAAARLFAAADSRGASLRAIAREAGVNPALVHYHFGSREPLLRAVILRALMPIQARRRELLAGLRARPQPPDARDLAKLFVAPLMAEPTSPTRCESIDLRLLGRISCEERGLAQEVMLEHFGGLMIEFGALLDEALPGIPRATRQRRMRFCVQAALETLSNSEANPLGLAASPPGEGANRQTLVGDLIDFLAGGLAAPASPAPSGYAGRATAASAR